MTPHNPTPHCLRCTTTMVEGFTLDMGQAGFRAAAHWVASPPVKSWVSGLDLSGQDRGQIRTYRCPACGLLESYVTELSS